MEIFVTLAWFAVCVLAADFITGVMHWAEDTWLCLGRSELLDRWIVRDNIEHHRMPGKIRQGTYLQTNGVSIALSLVVIAILALCHAHAWQGYAIALLTSHANHIHKWAHSSRVRPVVAWLQTIGLLQSRTQHAKHHKAPYAGGFCAMTNYLNPILDRIHFWRALEAVIETCGITVKRATPARAGF